MSSKAKTHNEAANMAAYQHQERARKEKEMIVAATRERDAALRWKRPRSIRPSE